MINAILLTLIKVVLFIIRSILNIVLLPITAIINGLFPGLSNFIYDFNTLLNTYLFPGLAFGREVIYNLTGINRELLGILISIPLTYLTFTILNASVRFIVSIYRIWKTGRD